MGQKLDTSKSNQSEDESAGGTSCVKTLEFHESDDDTLPLNDTADTEWEIKVELELEENISEDQEIASDENDSSKQLKCYECGLSFTTRRGFNKHDFNHHRDDVEKSHKCDFCEKLFATILSLKSHVKTYHEDFDKMYPYKCGCGKSYGTNYHLKRHQVKCRADKIVCQNELPSKRFKCKKCELTCATKRNLIEHCIRHHGKNSQKLIKCEICKEGFATVNSRYHHMKIKHPRAIPLHKCQKCNKTFSSSSTRNRHEKTHENTCNYCQKSFSSRNVLYIHKKNCSKKVLFSCNHCLNKYECQDSLSRHLKARHYAKLPDLFVKS